MNCIVCDGPTALRCSGCKSVFYCTREHQKKHWSTHRRECKPYEILTSEKQGRYLVATRDMKAGDMVMKESVLILGPKAATSTICLGCHRAIGDSAVPCPGCRWPLCSTKCQSSPFHTPECHILKRSIMCLDPMALVSAAHSSVTAAYSFLTPLRCLLLKKTSKKSWESLLNLQSHLEQRLTTQTYAAYRKNVARFIGEVLGMYSEGFDDETILRMCGILDTNSFELKCSTPKSSAQLPDTVGDVRARAILSTASLINHDCCPNTRHTFEQEGSDGEPWRKFSMVVYTTRDVRKGEPLTATYTQSLWPTKRRRAHLIAAKCFSCDCIRCTDPTELGTNIGSFRCLRGSQNGCNGILLPCNPLEDTSPWKCEKCGQESTWKEVDAINETLHDEILERASKANKAKNDNCPKKAPEILEEFLIKYESILHPNNHHCLQVKHALIQCYGQTKGLELKELPYDMLERKVNLCNDLLQVSNLLEPGLTRLRGEILHDLYTTIVEKTKRDISIKKKQTEAEKARFAEVKKMLKENIEVLQSDHDTSYLMHL